MSVHFYIGTDNIKENTKVFSTMSLPGAIVKKLHEYATTWHVTACVENCKNNQYGPPRMSPYNGTF